MSRGLKNGKYPAAGFMMLLLFILLTGCEQQLPTAKTGMPAPTFTLNHLNGTTIQFPEHYRGKIVAIRFWADWCPFCKTEMTALEPVYRHYRDRGLVILAINVMQSPEEVRAFTDRMGISYEVLLDSQGEVMRRYGVMGLPMTFIVDRGHDHPFGQKNLDYASQAPLHPGYTGFCPNDDHGRIIKTRIAGESTADAFASILDELL